MEKKKKINLFTRLVVTRCDVLDMKKYCSLYRGRMGHMNADFKSAFGSAKYLKGMTILNVLLLLNSFKADISSLQYLVNIFIGSFLNHYLGAYRLISDEGQASGLHGLLNITTQYVYYMI